MVKKLLLFSIIAVLGFATSMGIASDSNSAKPCRHSCTTTTVTTTNPTTSTTTPASTYPASYFSGPLGQNEILPASTTGFLSGMWSGEDGFTPTQARARVEQRIADSGRTFNFISAQLTLSDLGNSDTYGTRSENWIHSLGSIPMFSVPGNWAPADVAAGLHDDDLQLMANRFATFGFPVLLRVWREQNSQSSQLYFTGDSNDTQAQLDQIAANWIAGWRYYVNFFRTHGATNVGFVWCPSELANRNNTNGFTGRNQLLATYPGDAYVDWVGVDRYNHGVNGGFSTPLHNGWASFDELFNYHTLGYAQPSIADEYGPSKPVMVYETASHYDPAQPSRKADWFINIADVAKPHMPYLYSVQFFDQWITSNSADWRVDSNQVSNNIAKGSSDSITYQGWKDFENRPVANVGVLGG